MNIFFLVKKTLSSVDLCRFSSLKRFVFWRLRCKSSFSLWCDAAKNIYLNTVFKYSFEILLLHCVAEGNNPLHFSESCSKVRLIFYLKMTFVACDIYIKQSYTVIYNTMSLLYFGDWLVMEYFYIYCCDTFTPEKLLRSNSLTLLWPPEPVTVRWTRGDPNLTGPAARPKHRPPHCHERLCARMQYPVFICSQFLLNNRNPIGNSSLKASQFTDQGRTKSRTSNTLL